MKDLFTRVSGRIPLPLLRPAQRARRRVRRGRVDWGDLRRTSPFSDVYGFDRGTPVDRFFIDRFLTQHEADIAGHVLEVGSPEYASSVGRARVQRVDVLDIDPSNSEATIIADLSEQGSIPSRRFDCFVLTQTLQYVSDVGTAVRNAVDALVPGGVLLLSVPMTSRLDPTSGFRNDLWRFTPGGLELILKESAADAESRVTSFGNVLTTVAFSLGLSAEELREDELLFVDEAFPMVLCARVQRRV